MTRVIRTLKQADAYEILDEDMHMEWTILQKLLRMDSRKDCFWRKWPSLETKMVTLCKECKGGKVIGIAARESLTVGGDRDLMWVDIDTPHAAVVDRWLAEQTLFPRGSFRHIQSTTLNSHIYVATDIPLRESCQDDVREVIRRTMPRSISGKLDRVYGPECPRPIFLPMLNLVEATPPQVLMSSATATFKLSRHI